MTQYDINIKKYQYIRSNYYLDTTSGRFVLRKVDLPKEQILFNYEVDAHLRNNQFKAINPICVTKKKLPYAPLGDQLYVLQRYTNCEETDFRDQEDLTQMIYVMAQFHYVARKVKSGVKDASDVRIKNIYDVYCKRMQQNAKLKKTIMSLKNKSSFEILFLEGASSYRALEEMAIESINHDLIERLIAEVKRYERVAHKDYTYHTVNKTGTGEYLMSNIDCCNYDIQVVDLAQILCKIMPKNDWNSKLLYHLIGAYNKVCPLSEDEFRLLKFMLIYPEKYNSICHKYMSSKRRWNYNMFEQKWENMLLYKDQQINTTKEIQGW